ncbi:MAG: hypothetical protein WCI76_01580, partial [bacterium]
KGLGGGDDIQPGDFLSTEKDEKGKIIPKQKTEQKPEIPPNWTSAESFPVGILTIEQTKILLNAFTTDRDPIPQGWVGWRDPRGGEQIKLLADEKSTDSYRRWIQPTGNIKDGNGVIDYFNEHRRRIKHQEVVNHKIVKTINYDADGKPIPGPAAGPAGKQEPANAAPKPKSPEAPKEWEPGSEEIGKDEKIDAARERIVRNQARMELLLAELEKRRAGAAKATPTPVSAVGPEVKTEPDSPELAKKKADLEKNLEKPFWKISKYFFNRPRAIMQIAKLEKAQKDRREAMEKDKKINPFKWFLVSKMDEKVFRLIFGQDKSEVSVENVNRIFGNEKGETAHSWTPPLTGPNSDLEIITANGFALQWINKKELQKKNGFVMYDDQKAQYKLMRPNGTYYYNASGEVFGFKDAKDKLEEDALLYQHYMEEEFEKTNNI